MTNNEMTKREFLNSVIEGITNEETKAFAEAEIEKMDAANAKNRERAAKKRAESNPLVDKVVEMLGEEPITATEVAAELEVTIQKASAMARRAVKEGRATQVDVKIKGKGTVKGYLAV